MKKVFLPLLFLAALSMVNKASAQMKVAVFDIDLMVRAMPGIAGVDSLVQIYQRDSLGAEYSVLTNEFHRLDSTFKSDSAAKKSQAVLDYSSNQRIQVYQKLIYWQQYAQQKSDQKSQLLAQPLYEKVVTAYQKVLGTKKYALILKPQTYEQGTPVDNLFISVAKELKMTELPQELIYLGPEDASAPQNRQPAAGTATKPATGAKTPAKP